MATNTFLFPGDNDWLAQPGDILKLIMHLPNIVENYQVRKYYLMSIRVVLEIHHYQFLNFSCYQVPWVGWNHFDFLYAIDIDLYQNEHLMKVLKEHPIN